MLKKLLLAALAAPLFVVLATTAAQPDEPALPPEVETCLSALPGAILLGQETDGPDIVCLALGEHPPTPWQAGDVYACSYIPCAMPEPIATPTPEPTPEPEPKPVAPENVEAQAVVDPLARAISRRAKVTYDRVPGAETYVVRCEGERTKTIRARATLRAKVGTTCIVRAIAPSGKSPWSKPARVKR